MRRRRQAWLAAVGITISLCAPSLAAASHKGAATITGSFSPSCRAFSAHSSKDVSHVVVRYYDGRVVKDESTTTPEYSIEGGPGDEIASVDVKSGTTRQGFACAQASNPPTAMLEIETPTSCFPFSEILYCNPDEPRTTWTQPDNGQIQWPYAEPERQCPQTYSFRGTGSIDPEADISTWSIDFGDGTSASGSWSGGPPTEVTHSYPCFTSPTVTLTVTDSSGQSDSDELTVFYVDARPD